MHPTRLTIAILALSSLLGCADFQDTNLYTGFVEVTVVPAEAALEGFSVSTINIGFHERIQESDGNVALLETPVGDQRLTVGVESDHFVPAGVAEYEGDVYYRKPITITRGTTKRIIVEFRPKMRFSSSGFTVTRYETARLTLRNVVAATPITIASLDVRCTEQGYPNLQTYFRATDLVIDTTPRNVTLNYSSGFSYFTDNTVSCRFDLLDAEKRPARIDWN